MTSTIYQKLKSKRKYHKTPPCGHTDGYCDMEHCRKNYAIKLPKNFGKMSDEVLHREKVIKRRREIELVRLDAEQEFIQQGQTDKDFHVVYKGEYGKRREQIKKYKRMMWTVVAIFIALPILYVLAIMVIYLIN